MLLPCKKPVSKERPSRPFAYRILVFHANSLAASMSQQLIDPRARTSTQWDDDYFISPMPCYL